MKFQFGFSSSTVIKVMVSPLWVLWKNTGVVCIGTVETGFKPVAIWLLVDQQQSSNLGFPGSLVFGNQYEFIGSCIFLMEASIALCSKHSPSLPGNEKKRDLEGIHLPLSSV